MPFLQPQLAVNLHLCVDSWMHFTVTYMVHFQIMKYKQLLTLNYKNITVLDPRVDKNREVWSHSLLRKLMMGMNNFMLTFCKCQQELFYLLFTILDPKNIQFILNIVFWHLHCTSNFFFFTISICKFLKHSLDSVGLLPIFLFYLDFKVYVICIMKLLKKCW